MFLEMFSKKKKRPSSGSCTFLIYAMNLMKSGLCPGASVSLLDFGSEV